MHSLDGNPVPMLPKVLVEVEPVDGDTKQEADKELDTMLAALNVEPGGGATSAQVSSSLYPMGQACSRPSEPKDATNAWWRS